MLQNNSNGIIVLQSSLREQDTALPLTSSRASCEAGVRSNNTGIW